MAKRKKIKTSLQGIGKHRVIEITPQEIDNRNINTLEEEAFIDHILFFKPTVVYLDAPTHPRGIPALTKRIELAIASEMAVLPRFIIEPKADLNYPIVGAASIVANIAIVALIIYTS